MKLNLGNNIRRLRVALGLTQEQFAEKIGMSAQAISRWECGSTYPDMELIPVIAEFFKVTTDSLFDMSTSQKETSAKAAMTELDRLTHENPLNHDKIIALIREIRQNYLACDAFWHFWHSTGLRAMRDERILPEVRLTFDAVMSGDYPLNDKVTAISQFSIIEDEEHIDALLNTYATTDFDISRNALLYNRYQHLGDRSKSDIYRQHFLYLRIDELIGSSRLWHDKAEPFDPIYSRAAIELGLELLHRLCMCKPDESHPISGNGEVDMWVEPRLWMGVRMAGHLARAGEHERALIYLEDTVSLLEKTMKITDKTKLFSSSPWLGDITFTAEEDYSVSSGSFLLATERERIIYIHDKYGYCYCIYPSWYYEMLTATEDTKWYTRDCDFTDSLRSDKRYIALCERVHALIKIRHE